MPNITIISQKGGSGKTTIALHLAASATQAKQPACVIDTDPQATAAAWGDWRGDFYPLVVTSPLPGSRSPSSVRISRTM